MKIVSWNVNGIRACAKKEDGFFYFIEKERPDILSIQETKAHPDQLSEDLLSPFGAQSFFSSASRKGYSGTATYLFGKEMAIPEESVTYGINIKKFDSEGRFVVTQHEDFLLYNVYFPNGSAREERHLYKMEFLDKFTRHLSKKIKEGREVIVLGDYNVAHKEVDVFDPVRLSTVSGFLPEEREWFSKFLEVGFVDVFRKFFPDAKERYSWWSYREMARQNNRGWRIDYICTTPGLASRVTRVDILDQQLGSDHCPVVMEME